MAARAHRVGAMLLHLLAQGGRRALPVALGKRRDVGRWCGRGRPQQRLEHPLPAQHHRRPVGIRGRGQHAAVPQQAPSRRVADPHPPEMAPVDVGNAVVFGQAGIEERVVGPEQVEDTAVVAHLALEEQLGFPAQGVAQGVVDPGKDHGVRHHRLQVAHLEPLAEEVAHPARRAPVGQHPSRLPGQHGGIAQRALLRQIQQLVVRHAPPQEERQARRQLDVRDGKDRPHLGAGRLRFGAQEKRGHAQERFQRQGNPGLEVAGVPPGLVNREQRLEVDVGDRAPVRAAGQRAQDVSRARRLVRGPGRAADEDALAARGVRGRAAVERPHDLEGAQTRHQTVADAADGGRRHVGKGSRDEPRPALDLEPHVETVIGRLVVEGDLPRHQIVFRRRNAAAPDVLGALPPEPAPDRQTLDQRVVDAQVDPVFPRGDAAADRVSDVALQAHPEQVGAVERERVPHGHPAATRERRVLVDPRILPHRHGQPIHLPQRAVLRRPQRHAADLRGRRDVAIHQGGRHPQHLGVVVEAEARHVAREQRPAVDLERQQVANDVDVLGAIEPMRGHPPRVRRRGADAVELHLEGLDERKHGRSGQAAGGPGAASARSAACGRPSRTFRGGGRRGRCRPHRASGRRFGGARCGTSRSTDRAAPATGAAPARPPAPDGERRAAAPQEVRAPGRPLPSTTRGGTRAAPRAWRAFCRTLPWRRCSHCRYRALDMPSDR